MKRALLYILFLLTINSVGQKYFDLSKVKVSKPKTFKLEPSDIVSPVLYTASDYDFVFDKSEITIFINDISRFGKFNIFNFDSLKTFSLTTKNDTIQFNKFASAFDDQIVLRLIDNLIMQKKIAILSNGKRIFPNIKRVSVSQDMGGCIWTGYITYINDKYFFDEVTSQARTLD